MKTAKNQYGQRKNIFVLLCVLVLILLCPAEFGSSQQEVYLSLNKQSFGEGEKVLIIVAGADSGSYKFEIYSPTKIYTYIGELKSAIDFYPEEAGEYSVKLFDAGADAEGALIDSINFTVTNEAASEENYLSEENPENIPQGYTGENFIFTDKEGYSTEETIHIFLKLSEDQKSSYLLYYQHGDAVYSYDGKLENIEFNPLRSGVYRIMLKDSEGGIIETRQIVVSEDAAAEVVAPDEIQLDDNQYEGFGLTDNTAPDELRAEDTKNYSEEESILKNKLRIDDKSGKIKEFNVNIISKRDGAEQDSRRGSEIDKSPQDIFLNPESIQETADVLYDLEIEFEGNSFKKLILNNLSLNINSSSELKLGLEEVLPSAIKGVESGNNNVIKAFGVDPSSLSFTTGTLNVVASGTELWKCREWNFAEQKCYGSWIKIKDITPGTEYYIEISPEDPGYAETGLATINTDKSTYHINESAKITAVVLDAFGYLVADANVTVIVTNPENETSIYSTGLETLLEDGKGIYSLIYEDTYIGGTYSLFVQAEGAGVNYSMSSEFEVKEFYDFDILREIPVTMDPWNENLSVNITFISYNYTGLFSFTELLPINFTLYGSGGAVVSYSGEYLVLSWYNLTNNSVINYFAGVPQLSPELYMIGPGFVSYETEEGENKNYTEARPWFLAVDPILFAQVCVAQDNTNGQDTYDTACDGTYPAACGGGAADRLTCNDGNSETHTGTNNNRWAGARISSYNSSIQYCVAVTQVYLCYEWWMNSGYDVARIAVDNDDWASPTTISSTLPGTSANPGVTCTDVTSNDNWVCGNFDGTGTAAQVVAQAQRNNAGGTTTLTIDVLYFNVTYTTDSPPTVSSLNYPANNANITSASVTFNFTAVDDIKVQNCSLYMNISGWTVQGTATSVTNNTNTNITVSPSEGNYLWNIRCYDNSTAGYNSWYSSNYTVRIDRTGPVVVLDRPANASTITSTAYVVNATVSDAFSSVDKVMFEYRPNSSASWSSICSASPVGGVVNCTWNLTGLTDGSDYQVRAMANDTLGNIGSYDTHTNMVVSLLTPPSIYNIQCFTNSWTSCSNVGYGSILGAVRTNCTSNNGGTINNASFMLRNVEDNYVYFNSTVTSTTNGLWEYNFSDVTIYDSGSFNLNVVCRENPENSTDYNWTVPWGTLNSSLVSPNSNANVSQNKFFTFSSNVSCSGGECGYVEAILDPVSPETADAGVVNDNDGGNDEEGGSYTDTQTNNGAYFAIGENTNGANDNVNSQIDFSFNISSLGITADDLNNLNVSITYCYSGADTYAAINCDGGTDAPEKTPNGAQDIWIYNYNTSSWTDIGDLDTSGGETETTDVYTPTGNLSNYINNSLISVRVEYVTNNANNNDAWLAVDYLYLNVDYTFIKSGAVSTTVGALPFYTTDANPQNTSHESCLGNMSSGDSCTVYWDVNATGEINTTHEFYVIYNLTTNGAYVSDSETSHINLTIIQNTAPSISYADISPNTPGPSEDLTCSFLVYDSSLDTLFATVYWYKSNVLMYNETVSVSNGVEYSHILDEGNTSASDTWHCGIIPYDGQYSGAQLNSSPVNVSASLAPVISSIQCQRYGVVWGACSNVLYDNQFTAVRATCTDSDGYVQNVSFTFSNQEDSYTYFSDNYSSSAGNVFTLDFADITIEDSGTFNIDVSCVDNSSTSSVSSVSWTVPWGTLSSQLISPYYNINVTQNHFFNFTSQIACSGGECGNINATLDPTPSWWDGHYRYRMRLNITNNQASSLQTGYSMNVTINTSSSKFLSNGNDLRIVWLNGSNWVELDRINETTSFNYDYTEVWFKLQQAISASSSDATYYVYYGYSGASAPPTNRSRIYLYFDDFNRADVSDINTEAAYGQTGGGTWSISGSKLVNVGAAGDPNKLEIDALGDVNYDVDMFAKINIYSTLGSASDLWRMGLSSNIDDVGGDGQGYCLLLHEDHSSLDMLNDLRSWGTYGSYSWNVNTWYNMRFRVIDPSTRNGYGKVWVTGTSEPSAWTINNGTFGTGTARGYGELGFGGSRQGDTTYFDDILIRYIVRNEPTFQNSSEEEYGLTKGIIPMNSGDPFYTVTSNPMDYSTAACLASMKPGDACNTTWSVNATGTINSTWEFFVIYSSQYEDVSNETTSTVNLTIIQNAAPIVSAVTLTPALPLHTDDLYCNFTVVDYSLLDTLYANVTWYLNGSYHSSSIVPVFSGIANYAFLDEGNTSAGQVWRCGVKPYDQSAAGVQVNSSNVTILQNMPPVINSIECMKSGSWTNCSNLVFNNQLQGVRANCTSESGHITNATISFSNTPDNYTYFNQSVYTNTSDFWAYYQNVTMNNSGEFRVNVICTDNNSASASSYTNWSLPWGTINVTLINPSANTFVEQNEFFNFSAQINCSGGECGRVEVTLDPISGSSPATGTPDSGFVYDNPGNDEEGGSYVQTQTYDGPQTATPGTNFYYIIGEGDTANTALSYINLRYNLSSLDLVAQDITSIRLNLSYCHSGEDDVSQDFCDNDAPMEKTADGAQNVEIYDFVNNVWVDIGDITVNANEAMYNSSYLATGTLANYVNSSSKEVMVRYEADFSDTGGDGFLAIDYATITVAFTKLKRGAVSTVPGTIPFYTTNANPVNYSHLSCLYNMISGASSCELSWLVNATGALNSTHDFFIIYEMITNAAYVADGESRHINITISDSSLIPPVVTLNLPSNNYNSRISSVNFTCSATDTGNLQNMSLYGNFSGTFAFNGSDTLSGTSDSSLFERTLGEGRYVWNCLAYDTDGNYDWGDSNRTLIVDLTAPRINLTAPSENQMFSSSNITFNITVSDNIDSVLNCNLTVDSAVVEQFTASSGVPKTIIENLSQGEHYWNVTCADDAGNSNISETRRFTISDIPPTVSLITANNIYQQNPSITLQYLPSDNNGITQADLIINGSIYATNTSVSNNALNSFTISPGQGRFNWTVNVSDVSNLTAQAAERYFTIDWTDPEINLTYPQDNYSTNASSIMFNFNVTDNLDSGLTCDLRIDGVVEDNDFSAVNGANTSRTINGINDGIHYWNVTCIDDSGNTGNSQTFMLNISNPPVVALNSPAINYSFNYNNPTFYYTATDNYNISNCSFMLDGQINATDYNVSNGNPDSFTIESIEEGYHNWSVMCYDAAGLISNIPQARPFLIDLHLPEITLHNPVSAAYNGTSIMFNYTATDNYDLILSCNLTLDGQVNASNVASPNATPVNFTLSITTEGTHYWNITCADDAGNYNTSETWNFSNVVPPTVTLDSPAPNALFNYSNNIEFIYQPYDNQGLANTTLYINGVYNQSDPSPNNGALNSFFVNFSVDGVYSWQVNATDVIGLIGGSEIRNITVDTSAPIIGIISPAQAGVVDWNNVNFTFNVTDNLDSVLVCNVSVDGSIELANALVQSGSTNRSSKILYDGNHNWSVTCVDDVGWIAYSGIINFSVSAPPRVTLNFPINNYKTKSGDFTFNYTPEDAIGIENCSLYINDVFNQSDSVIEHNQPNYFTVLGMPDGLYNWTVECMDELPDGNLFSPESEIFIVDNQGPNITLNYPSEGIALNGNNVTFNWTATDYAGTQITCNLTLDGVVNQTNIINISGASFTRNIDDLQDGPHNWSVTCADDLGNPSTSVTGNFTINQPDLYIDDNRISFNNTNPHLNQIINITANVSNIGGVDASNAVISFWDGDPAAGGTFIGNDTGTVLTNGSRVFSVNWTIGEGYHTIYVLADPANIIGELNETNNNATKNISVLWANITAPPNGSMYNYANITFNFTLRDYTAGILSGMINYTVYVDGAANGQTGQTTDNVSTSINITLTQGIKTVILQATDYLLRKKNSSAISVIVDWTPPNSSILTANASWYNYTTPLINITAADNIDSMINYTIYANGTANYYGNISNNSQLLININALPEGIYQLIMEAFDDLSNTANSSIKTIYVDLTPPAINLNAPPGAANFTARSVGLNYTPEDNLASTLYCNITLDGAIVNSQTVSEGNSANYTATNLSEGTHYWNVTCRDEAYNYNTSETRNFTVAMGPSIVLVSPADNYWSKLSTNIFYFNVSDETGIENCTLLLNGSAASSKTNAQIILNGTNNLTATAMNGTYTWAVECYDNTTYKAYNLSSSRTIYVDTEIPNAAIYTLNDSWFKVQPTLYFNLSDNMDSVLNYTVFINGTANKTGTANNRENSSTTLSGLANGSYEIIIQAMDEALNYANSSAIIIWVDAILPSINLTYPGNDTNHTASTLDLNFTPYDNLANYLICNVTLDGSVVLNNYAVNNGENQNVTVNNLVGGYHYWNATCIDRAGNTNTSETRRFYIYRPDIYVNSSKIYFSNDAPIENETITITATVENLGTSAAGNFTVEIWDGLPGAGGAQIGANSSINLTVGESRNISVSYTARIGTNTIYVFADRNNSIAEENESNNNASRQIFVGLWHYATGSTDDRLVTQDAQLGLLFEWDVNDSSQSNIFVVDADSDINWRALQALGRDTSNNSAPNDFTELDVKLNSTNYADSINTTYTAAGVPKETESFTVYSTAISNVPVYNSTNNSNFKTGILWDYGDGGASYNGAQDVLFVSRISKSTLGYNSTVDYEIRIPATLRSYTGPDTSRVEFYTEIK